MECRIYPLGTLNDYRYVVILSSYQGKIMLSRHKKRITWEAQGGHIELGELPLEAAKRELYEESGAIRYRITGVFDYCAGDAGGVVFAAEIEELGSMPESEMAETALFDTLPGNLTYPEITPVLFQEAVAAGKMQPFM